MSSILFQFSDWFGHSIPFVLPQKYPLPCLNSELLALQEKQVEVAAVLKWSQTAAALLGEHMQGVLTSMKGLDDSSNWGYRCCHKEHL